MLFTGLGRGLKQRCNLVSAPSVRCRALWWVLIAASIYATTAWFSEGYFQYDEHFQILELASYKLGRMPAGDLPWEFSARIRPGLQPLLAVIAIRSAELVGIGSPFLQAFLMRLAIGLLSLLMFRYWAIRLSRTSGCESAGKTLPLAVVLIWFVPFLSVRFSSENTAALAFWSGALLYAQGTFGSIELPASDRKFDKTSDLQCFFGGLLLGLSFYFRFQIAFSILGVCAWTAWKLPRKGNAVHPTSRLFLALLGGAAAMAIGAAADQWLYGEPVLTALRYVQVNLLQGKAAEFGVEPWWFYFRKMITSGPPPIAVIGLALIAAGLWRHRANILTWALVPFVIAHLAIGHKELRFLFPMILPSLLLALLGWHELFSGEFPFASRLLRPPFKSRSTLQKCGLYAVAFVGALGVGINFLLLPMRCLLPVDESIRCFHFLYDRSRLQPLTIVSLSDIYHAPYLPPISFYRDKSLHVLVAHDVNSGLSQAASIPGALWVSSEAQMSDIAGMRVQRIYAFLPIRPAWSTLTRGDQRLFVWSVTRPGSLSSGLSADK